MNVLISACLMGMECRYDGSGYYAEELNELKKRSHLIPICPEIYGGLQTPRDPAEIQKDRVITSADEDVTAAYQRGAQEILKLARFYNCSYAILKERSPSCGFGKIYDGTFSGRLIEGNGLTADLLSKEGICIIGETKLKEFLTTL